MPRSAWRSPTSQLSVLHLYSYTAQWVTSRGKREPEYDCAVMRPSYDTEVGSGMLINVTPPRQHVLRVGIHHHMAVQP